MIYSDPITILQMLFEITDRLRIPVGPTALPTLAGGRV